MKVCIHKNLLGSDQHLQTDFEKETAWVGSPCPSSHLFGFSETDDIAIISKLSGVGIPTEPDLKFAKAFQKLGIKLVDWSKALPRSKYRKYVESIQNAIRENLKSDQYEYFKGRVARQQKLISSLQPAHIDEKIFARRYADPTTVNKSVLATFTPMKGVTRKVGYNLTGTSTGRLTISEGPQILTLKAEMRDIRSCPLLVHEVSL